MNNVFLGKPPASIEQWIKEHAQPAGHPETRVKYVGGATATFNIEGELTDSSIDNIEDVEEVDIGNTVTSIGENAFRGCESLMSVTIPNTVTSIGYEAFDGCAMMMSVTIPNRVTSIGERAFGGCLGLMSVTIPDSVTSIGNYAFGWCEGLASVTFNSFTKNEVKSMTTDDYIFGSSFYMEKSFTAICTDGSMTVHFSADDPATITFTDL